MLSPAVQPTSCRLPKLANWGAGAGYAVDLAHQNSLSAISLRAPSSPADRLTLMAGLEPSTPFFSLDWPRGDPRATDTTCLRYCTPAVGPGAANQADTTDNRGEFGATKSAILLRGVPAWGRAPCPESQTAWASQMAETANDGTALAESWVQVAKNSMLLVGVAVVVLERSGLSLLGIWRRHMPITLVTLLRLLAPASKLTTETGAEVASFGRRTPGLAAILTSFATGVAGLTLPLPPALARPRGPSRSEVMPTGERSSTMARTGAPSLPGLQIAPTETRPTPAVAVRVTGGGWTVHTGPVGAICCNRARAIEPSWPGHLSQRFCLRLQRPNQPGSTS